VEDGQVEVKSGIIRTRTVSLGNMCLLQSIGAHSQTIERRETEERGRQQTRTTYTEMNLTVLIGNFQKLLVA